jgi:hypothetical protein
MIVANDASERGVWWPRDNMNPIPRRRTGADCTRGAQPRPGDR